MSLRVSFELNDRQVEYIDVLLKSGFYGLDRVEATERLVCLAIESEMRNGCEPVMDALKEACSRAIESSR